MSIANWLLKLWNSKLNPLGNYDDPIPPEWCFQKHGKLAYFYWYFIRNPLHNFTHYWIGTMGSPCCWNVFCQHKSWNLILPFFSYKNRFFEFYIGWRPKGEGDYRQVFGIAFRIRKK